MPNRGLEVVRLFIREISKRSTDWWFVDLECAIGSTLRRTETGLKALEDLNAVFCASLADVFDNQADPVWRRDLFELICATPALDWQLLTKRPQNIRKMLPRDWGDEGYPNVWLGFTAEDQARSPAAGVQLLTRCRRQSGSFRMSPQSVHCDWRNAAPDRMG
ncbi:MAG: phage Gp37/Gp68 family protein [Hyphomicrobium sp.]|nr:phage Gp37/Gp68 family protein [Hyphomicrobium sp.]